MKLLPEEEAPSHDEHDWQHDVRYQGNPCVRSINRELLRRPGEPTARAVERELPGPLRDEPLQWGGKPSTTGVSN